MTIFILIFITLSLMGSALWILPSKHERQKMDLRLLARRQQMTVQLTTVELPDKWDKTTHKSSACAYHKYRHKPLNNSVNNLRILPYDVWKYDTVCSGWWSSLPVSLSTDSQVFLQKHASQIVAIEVGSHRVSFFWHEQGDEAVVDAISSLLDELLMCPLV